MQRARSLRVCTGIQFTATRAGGGASRTRERAAMARVGDTHMANHNMYYRCHVCMAVALRLYLLNRACGSPPPGPPPAVLPSALQRHLMCAHLNVHQGDCAFTRTCPHLNVCSTGVATRHVCLFWNHCNLNRKCLQPGQCHWVV